MQDVYNYLKKLEVNFLATTRAGGVPSCRPFGDPVMFDHKIYILTDATKDVAKQIAENNQVCIVAYDGSTWMRIFCELINDSQNRQAKRAIIDEFDWAEEAGFTLGNPNFACYYLANAQAEIRDSSGNCLAKYNF